MGCSHNFRPCGPQQVMCKKCGLLRNTGTPRRLPRIHRHVWHMDRRAKRILCKTCGEVK